MARLIAIGDIHGRLSKLEGLIEKIRPQRDDKIIFLGDYIDRGADSYKVVEFVINFKKQYTETITLKGNHEDYINSFFMGNQSKHDRDLWINVNGGRLTLASYKNEGYYLKVHKDFFMSLPLCFETEEYFFCHAGVRPRISLDKQLPSDLLSIREPFLSSKEDFGKIIIHGHTIVDAPTILLNRINIDTGAGTYGSLTAIELPSQKVYQHM